MDTLLQDLRFAVRLLWKDKTFTVTAVATLAICLGANTAIFGIVNSVLLRPVRVPEPERLVLMYNSYPNAGVTDGGSSGVPDYYDRLRQTNVFEELALYNDRGRTIGAAGNPERVSAMQVTPSLFRLLRIPPARGRMFTDAEGEIGSEKKVILSHALWQRLFGGNDQAIGQDLRIDGEPFMVVGVMPPAFRFISPDVRLWIPAAFTPEQKSDESRHSNNWNMIGRLKPDAGLAQAQSQIDALNARNLDRFPALKEPLVNAGFRTVAVPLSDHLVRHIRGTLYLLWGGVAFVLLIGCVNIANLSLVRSTARMKELATRYALGAGERRMARQLLTETTLMTMVGGVLGLAIGAALLGSVERLGLEELTPGSDVLMDRLVVAYGLGLSFLVGLLVGVIPVVRILGANLGSLIREEGRSGTASRGTLVLRRVLVTAQVSIALILLIGAALLFTSFRRVLDIDPGFRTSRVLTGMVSPPASKYKGDSELRNFYRRLMDEVRSLPGVEVAGATDSIPFGGDYSDSVVLAEGYQMKPGESLISADNLIVTPGYFETMGISLKAGRFFSDSDTDKAPLVAIVDDRLAKRFWGDANPIGRRLIKPEKAEDVTNPGPNVPRITVVGVVGTVQLRGLAPTDSRVGAYYYPYMQESRRGMMLAVKTSTDPEALTASIQRQLSTIDPELPFYQVHTMSDRLETSLVGRRMPMLLALAFGVIALALSAIGIYGMLAYQVAQRRREIGIRLALGSSGSQVFSLVLREGLLIVSMGLALGLAASLALARTLQGSLYGVKASDPFVLLSVTVVLSIVAIVACVVPAHRATRISPVVALGSE